jgi:hypothetical protein
VGMVIGSERWAGIVEGINISSVGPTLLSVDVGVDLGFDLGCSPVQT